MIAPPPALVARHVAAEIEREALTAGLVWDVTASCKHRHDLVYRCRTVIDKTGECRVFTVRISRDLTPVALTARKCPRLPVA